MKEIPKINKKQILDILVLCKDNQNELNRTLNTIPFSTKSISVNLKIFDGSSSNLDIKKFKNAFLKKNIKITYFNTQALEIKGIYKSMNYALTKVTGDWFIFMNSGDEFFKQSIFEEIEKYFFSNDDIKVLFGRAKIIGRRSWIMPSKRIKSINNWLKFFQPNHQSMFISNSISTSNKFNTNSPSNADHEWKKKLLKKYKYRYMPINICKFYLGGISSSYNLRLLKLKINERGRSKISKFSEIFKFILYKLNIEIEFLQFLKNYVVSQIF